MFETYQGRRSEVGVGGVVCMTRPWQGSTLLGYSRVYPEMQSSKYTKVGIE